MNSNIYIIGHKSPDLDSVAGAISYADFKNKTLNENSYVPAIAGELNLETKYLLEKTNISKPELIENAIAKKIILVDHNEKLQSVDGVDEADILEVLDHHKVVFSGNSPIEFCVKPWGASCTIIADKYFRNKIEIDKKVAMLMLGAILVDTVITKSPTCTSKDIEIIEKLAKICEINDWRSFGMEIFKIRSNVSELSEIEIIKNDYKEFELKAGKFGIGQVETVNLDDFKDKEEILLTELEQLKITGDYHSVILFITEEESDRILMVLQIFDSVEKNNIYDINIMYDQDIFDIRSIYLTSRILTFRVV